MSQNIKRAILIIDHGSRRPAANQMLQEVENLVKKMVDDSVIVTHAHMELAEPTIEKGIELCIEKGAQHIVAHPYMLAPGRHATEDIPRLVEKALVKYPEVSFEVTPPLGIHKGIAMAVLDRCNISKTSMDKSD